MKKKLLTILLSVFMMLTIMPMTIFAEGSDTKLDSSVASVKCDNVTTYYNTVAEAFNAANSATTDCEITILKECSHSGSLALNNPNHVITLNTGEEDTLFTITATEDTQNLILVKSHVKFTGNGGIITAECGKGYQVTAIRADGNSAKTETYDGFVLNVINGGTYTRGLVAINYGEAYLYGGKILCPKEGEPNANSGFSTIVAWTNSSVYIYGGEYHWDVSGTASSNKYWAGVLDFATDQRFNIYGGYFDGPLWWDSNVGAVKYTFYGGKFTTNLLKSSDTQKEGTQAWVDDTHNYLGSGKHSKKISETYNGTTYNFEVYDENAKVINLNNGTTYSSIANGMNNINSGDTLKMLQDISENVTVEPGKKFILDLNGHVLKPSNENSSIITVNGNLTVIDKAPNYTNKGYVDVNGLWHYDQQDSYSLQTSEFRKSINGGIITGGHATSGGGVYVANNGAFNMTSGTIIGNTASNSGGGIYADSGSNIILGGTVQISNNVVNNVSNNVYLLSNSIAIENPNNMLVGITLENGTGRFTKSNNVDKDFVNYFYSDNSNYTVAFNSVNDSDKYLELLGSNIIGTVKDNNITPIENATVKLMLGTKEIASSKTNDIGKFSFANVKNGTYNVVITTPDGKTKTKLVTINNTDSTTQNVEVNLSSGEANSIVECDEQIIEDTKLDIQRVIVGGLDVIAEAQTPSGTDKITIKLKVKPKEDENTSTQQEIKQVAGNGKKVEFIDMSLVKKVNNEEEVSIGNNNNQLLTIVIPFDFTGVDVDSVIILRHHDSSEKLTKNPASGQEGFKVDKDAGTITIYAKKFSSYAIAYNSVNDSPTPTPNPDPTPRYKVPNTGVEGTYSNNNSLLKLSSLSLLAVGTYLVIKKKER